MLTLVEFYPICVNFSGLADNLLDGLTSSGGIPASEKNECEWLGVTQAVKQQINIAEKNAESKCHVAGERGTET